MFNSIDEIKWKRVIILGIGGITASGKSTLASKLNEYFNNENTVNSELVHQDKYFKEGDGQILMDKNIVDKYPESMKNKIYDTNSPQSINFEKFIEEIRKKELILKEKEGRGILIVEGFLLWSCSDVYNLFDLIYFFDIKPQEDLPIMDYICERKWKRKYQNICTLKEFQEYWKLHPLPCYLNFGYPSRSIVQQKNFNLIDMSFSFQDHFDGILNNLLQIGFLENERKDREFDYFNCNLSKL
eukprot:TRINITY_DN15924_c0_g1_i1.p1 TRINITY_DN15924_c0_g1~~TRINITY_DN15924_c0_g1_i1.p1  ORF type:complete len:242 (-),score=57.16 TRINITY_DN15924_c0_g1_i1:303-1028(-)